MKHPTFWAEFEEMAGKLPLDDADSIQGPAKSATDHQRTLSCGPTMTYTETREENDQDAVSRELSTFLRAQSHTQTMTRTREEPDQDPVRSGLATVPRIAMMNTKTVTEVKREELDQDESVRRLAAFPRVGEEHG
ncbi:MAG: hypothetical protein K2Y21_02875 [Phycisphaerales bacterium]|nr:hypothetical protein [Phycisphaerales bacterium]